MVSRGRQKGPLKPDEPTTLGECILAHPQQTGADQPAQNNFEGAPVEAHASLAIQLAGALAVPRAKRIQNLLDEPLL